MNWREIFDAVQAHANDAQPHECCGIVLVTGEVVKCSNVFEPESLRHCRYTIDPLTLRRYKWEDVLGFYHSHPDGAAWPGETDLADAHIPGKLQIIVGMRKGTAYETRVFQCCINPATNTCRLMASQPEL